MILEAPVDASLGAMGSLLGKLDLVLAPGCRLPRRVMDGMHLLKDDVEELGVCLEDLSDVEDPPPTAKYWIKEARELIYDIEDYTNRFVLDVTAKIKTTRFLCKISHVKINRLSKRRKQHNQMVDIISEFRMYVKEAIERYERYELKSCSTFSRGFVSVGPMLPTPYEATADIVIDGRTSEFISSLASDGDRQLKVVSVLGSGCLGKTTLVKLLYGKFAVQFDCRAFIRVSKKPDMKRLFHDLLSQVQRPKPTVNYNEVDITNNIRKHLKDKRYLIIIDGLCAVSVWDIIKYAFPKGDCGSRIITTTKFEDVALACCCYHSEYVFELKPLDDDHSRKLFFNQLFGSESECPEEFKELSNKIVELCGGLPLAIISTASILARQPTISIDLLAYIHHSLSSCLPADSTSERTRQVLNLSYNNLPHHLKACLLYLSMYPEGYTICKEYLVKQWMAEGFIHTTEGQDMEKVAGSYFNELIDRRFIEPICISYNNEVLSCAVHDEVHDFIADKCAEENFIVVIDYNRNIVALSHKVRRLSLLFGDAKYAKIPANITTSQVRSLTFFGLFKCIPCITEFKLLRVLNLQLSGHHCHDSINLTGICELFHLRYLKIACDVCIQLPNDMQALQFLETLDAMNTRRVTAVPHDIIYLPHLLHLSLPVETNLLYWLGRNVVSLWSLGKLKDLQDLHLACSSTLPSGDLEALSSLLGGHGNLKTLTLVPGPSDKIDVVHGASKLIISWDGFVPPLLLQRFECSLHNCIFYCIPKWIEQLGNLCILKIAVSELLMNSINILRGLPSLTALSLYVQTAPVERIIFDKVGFSVLSYFKFRCTTVPWLTFKAGAMPHLQKLNLCFGVILQMDQRQHGTGLIRIEHLPGLKVISAKIGDTGSDVASLLTTTISNHPSNPRIDVRLIDYNFYGDESTKQKTQLDEYDKRFEKPADIRSLESSSPIHVPGFDINMLLKETRSRWLKPSEVYHILQNHERLKITPEPPKKPPSGSLFLYNSRVNPFFRKDGYAWQRKKSGRIAEAHELLKVGNVNVLRCYYAIVEQNPYFQRRCFLMLEPAYEHIVLVQYREISETGCLENSDLQRQLSAVGRFLLAPEESLDSPSYKFISRDEGINGIDNFSVPDNSLHSYLNPNWEKTTPVTLQRNVYGSKISEWFLDNGQFEHSSSEATRLTLAQKQWFSIREIFPEWAFCYETTKVIITGDFLCDSPNSCWAVMFGDNEVPVEIVQPGVLRCHTPLHSCGKLTLCITSGNKEVCSEVKDFEFREKSMAYSSTDLMPSSRSMKSSEELSLLAKFARMLLCENGNPVVPDCDPQSGQSPKNKVNDELWQQLIDELKVECENPLSTVDWIMEELLKSNLQWWLSVKLQGNDGSSLSKHEQGILHLISALGCEWALSSVLSAGVGINLRDSNGWTALHLAAYFGREKMVAALLAAGASAPAVTDPTAQDPVGKTAAFLASERGHRGLAGYLSEVSLTSYLASLTIEESDITKGSAAVEAERAVASISQRSAQLHGGTEDELSLKDSLAAVRNAAQAAARIQNAFRACSFRKRQEKDARLKDEYGMTQEDIDELAVASRSYNKYHVSNDRYCDKAAVSIQKKYRGWKGRKKFLNMRRNVVKIQAHVRGHQVRKKYKTFVSTVSVLEKVILRWRWKGHGLRGFRAEQPAMIEAEEEEEEEEDDDDFDDDEAVKIFRRQKVDQSVKEAVSRVLSMVDSPEARRQYRRMLEEFCQAAELGASDEAISILDDMMYYLRNLVLF